MNKAAQAYFQTKVNTTDQGQLLLMLYDGALNYLQQARDKMLARDFAGKGILISKVIDIVNELSSSLNMDRGGSLAVNLNNLYILCTARLLQAFGRDLTGASHARYDLDFGDGDASTAARSEEEALHPLCGSFLEELVLPGSLRVIGSCAFYNCRRLRRLSAGAGELTMGMPY